MLAASLLTLAVALGFAAVPPPKRTDPAAALSKGLSEARTKGAEAAADAAQARDRVTNRTWALPPEALGVRVMDTVNGVAERRGLLVSNFGVGKPLESAGLRQVPFAVTLDGPFPALLATMQDLEKPSTKLAIGGVKISPVSTGPEIGRVTAVLSITAFVREGA